CAVSAMDPVAAAVAPAAADPVPGGADVAVADALRVVGAAVPPVVAAAPAVVARAPEVPGAVGADGLVAVGRGRVAHPVVAPVRVLLDARGGRQLARLADRRGLGVVLRGG